MAQDIQVPSFTPPALQFQGAPTDLINSLYNRPKPGEMVSNALSNAASTLYDAYIKQQQLKAQAFGEGGPYLLNLLYGNKTSQTGQPSTSQGVPSSNVTPSTAGTPTASTPSNYGGQIASASQTFPQMDQSSQVPDTIKAHMQLTGSPNYSMAGNPNLGVHAQNIQGLQSQMGQNALMGKYGQTLNQGLSNQLAAEKALMEGEQFNVNQQREQNNFNTQQAMEESRFQRGQIAGAAKEAGKNVSSSGTILDDINNLRGLFKGYEPTPFLGSVGANISGASGRSNFGTKTMQQGNQINQVAPKLGAEINYELTQRFSPGESALLMSRVAPSATDDEANAKLKLDNLERLVSTFKSGDQNEINMVASAIAGRPVTVNIPTSGIGTKGQQLPGAKSITSKQEYLALPNGTPFVWNGKQHIKGQF